MNIPSPAAVKKLTDDRKAREAELASSLANAKDKMPPTKGESRKSGPSGKRVSTTSASSPTEKGYRDRSSNSSTRTSTSRRSTKSTRTSTTSPADGRKVPASTSTTPRKNSSTESTQSEQPKSKRVFVRPDHLTQKPLRDNEALLGLKKSLEKPARGQFKRGYRTRAGNEVSSKNGRTVKKETN